MNTLRVELAPDPLQKLQADLILDFEIENTALGKIWSQALIHLLKRRYFLEKHYSLLGHTQTGRTLAQLCRQLQDHIDYLKDEHSDPALEAEYSLSTPPTRTELNQLHHLFELLIGQTWSPNPRYVQTTAQVRHSIRQLNHLVHEIEAFLKAEGRLCSAGLVLINSFLGAPRKILSEQVLSDQVSSPQALTDRALGSQSFCENLSFTSEIVTQFQFGDVYLHYAQLGKTPFEAFSDHDDDIDASNINDLRFITGEFDIHLGPSSQLRNPETLRENINHWLVGKNHEAKAVVGRYKVARLSPIHQQQWDSPSLAQALAHSPQVLRISVLNSNQTLATHSYPYDRAQSEQLVQTFYCENWGKRLGLKACQYLPERLRWKYFASPLI